jgi:hypothetical protein
MGHGQNGLLFNQRKMNRKSRHPNFSRWMQFSPKNFLQQYDNIIAHGQIANRRAQSPLKSQMGIGYPIRDLFPQ